MKLVNTYNQNAILVTGIMETVSASAQDDSSGANPSSVKSDDSSPRQEGGCGSPPPNCAICLGTCRNKSFTDSCLHQFCFKCLLTWSRVSKNLQVKAECPLCKQNFRSIIHNVQSNHQYEEYMVEQRQTEETIERLDFDNLTASTRRFRYRTTLTLPRQESLAIQQLLLRHYPIMADVFPPPARAPPARRRRSPAAFRRTVYRHNLWARPLPDFTGRFRDCSPEFYRYNDSQMHRLVPWLNRELHYLLNENIGHISYVIARILELLPQYHINSPEFREALQVYFRDRTEHFLHELYCFASTPYDLTGYDRNIQYTTDTRISTMVNEVISSSESEASVDSDIVMVSSSEPAEPPPGPSRLPAPVYPQNYIPQPATNNVIPIETISHSDTDDDSSEVMVVGYIKPPQDRTPEVVDLLGSDSDVIVQDTTPPEPQAQSSENQDTRTAPLVKLILKRHASEQNPDSDSEDGTHRPLPTKRKKRQRSNDTATTTDTCRTTPSPPHSWESESSSESNNCSITTSPSMPTISTDSESFSSSNSSSRKRKPSKKRKYKKKHKDLNSAASDKKKHKKRKSRIHHKEKKVTKPEKDKNNTRKSNSGKGVKSSKKKEPPVNPQEQNETTLDQPSTSGTHRHRTKNHKRRRPSRESKRLRSVVNVMYSKKSNSETSSNGNTLSCNASNSTATSITSVSDNSCPNIESSLHTNTDASSVSLKPVTNSDSEDDLPLNLTIQKTYTSL
ncbi:unnamed protein product [Diatraea saccharalis]|uniref:E3 ubiquitin-protein ligase Topors n=1 Tax=Diatraea saccharalis TaxID=40085 RepID=A0A9N9RH42_9NEOP|nr:unnamed protein product [Diatraea saccharalis]